MTRHPLYLGWWLLHLGIGVFRGSAWVLVTLPVAILAEHPLVLAEEADLARQFGDFPLTSTRIEVASPDTLGSDRPDPK